MVDRRPGSHQQIVEIPLESTREDVSLRRVLEKREGQERVDPETSLYQTREEGPH